MANSWNGSAKIPIEYGACQVRNDGHCQEGMHEDLRTIARYKSGDRTIKAGKDIFGVGEPCDAIYNLIDGWVFLYTLLEDGRRQILQFALPGAVIGFHPVRGGLTTYSVQALTDSVVSIIPHSAFGQLAKNRPEIGMRLAWLISRDRSLAFDHLTSVGRHSAYKRVAHLLLELFIRCRSQWPGHRIERMQLPLTQEHIGDATGLTGVHVNRILCDLRTEGILEFRYRRFTILDPDKLVHVAGIDPQMAMSWVRWKPPE